MREAKNRLGCREVERETKFPELLAADLVTRYQNSLTTEEVDKLITLPSAIFGFGPYDRFAPITGAYLGRHIVVPNLPLMAQNGNSHGTR